MVRMLGLAPRISSFPARRMARLGLIIYLCTLSWAAEAPGQASRGVPLGLAQKLVSAASTAASSDTGRAVDTPSTGATDESSEGKGAGQASSGKGDSARTPTARIVGGTTTTPYAYAFTTRLYNGGTTGIIRTRSTRQTALPLAANPVLTRMRCLHQASAAAR